MGAGEDEAVVRAAIEAWNRDDWAAMEELNAPDGTMLAPEGWPESGILHGWDEIGRQYRRLKEDLAEETFHLALVEAPGDGWVLTGGRWRGRWTSGLELDMATWVVYRVIGGRIALTQFHLDEQTAREQVKSP